MESVQLLEWPVDFFPWIEIINSRKSPSAASRIKRTIFPIIGLSPKKNSRFGIKQELWN